MPGSDTSTEYRLSSRLRSMDPNPYYQYFKTVYCDPTPNSDTVNKTAQGNRFPVASIDTTAVANFNQDSAPEVVVGDLANGPGYPFVAGSLDRRLSARRLYNGHLQPSSAGGLHTILHQQAGVCWRQLIPRTWAEPLPTGYGPTIINDGRTDIMSLFAERFSLIITIL